MLYSREVKKYLSYQGGFKYAPNVVDNSEYAVWDVHFLGDVHAKDTPFLLQVPQLTEDFAGTFMSITSYEGHRPSQQIDPSVWVPIDSTDWVSDGTSMSRDFLIQSQESSEYLGKQSWTPSAQNEKNGAILWTLTVLNASPEMDINTNAYSLYGFLKVPEDKEYNYVIYDNVKNQKYCPRLGYFDLQNLWLIQMRSKNVDTMDEWIVELEVPSSVRSDHFPKWFMSSSSKGVGNQSGATKNRHSPSMDSESNVNTKWTLHIIGEKSRTETRSVYVVHIESNQHEFLTPVKNAGVWRPALTSDTSVPEKIVFELVILNGVDLFRLSS